MSDWVGIREQARRRRQERVRKKVQGTPARPRLSVFKSAKHIYGQLIDDVDGHTLAAASSSCSTVTISTANAGDDPNRDTSSSPLLIAALAQSGHP